MRTTASSSAEAAITVAIGVEVTACWCREGLRVLSREGLRFGTAGGCVLVPR
jgi:hypothetical protein